MSQPETAVETAVPRLPRQVAVIGAAGGLGQAILRVCRAEGIAFSAIVRSRPERIADIPARSRVAVVPSLADRARLAAAFAGVDAVITAVGVTASSHDRSALLSANIASVAGAMEDAGVDRIVLISSIGAGAPGTASRGPLRYFTWWPGAVGGGAREMLAQVTALEHGAFASQRWTLVRAGVNSRGKNEAPIATVDEKAKLHSLWPVSYDAMGRWMLEEAAACRFVREAPVVSRRRAGAGRESCTSSRLAQSDSSFP
jgi:hypothetical protein